MKFVIKDEENKAVEINLVKRDDGNIDITANGISILYLGRNGIIYRYTVNITAPGNSSLEKMGFQLNEDSKIKIYEVDK